ncbi:MAG: hypothetical protein AAGH15_21705, partial [Myxococcota bacterium]
RAARRDSRYQAKVILYRRKIPRVVGAGLVLSGGCFNSVVIDAEGSGGGARDFGPADGGVADAGAPDLGGGLDLGAPDLGAPDMGERGAQVAEQICGVLAECFMSAPDGCVDLLRMTFSYYADYGEGCYDAVLDYQACIAEALLDSGCDYAALETSCRRESRAVDRECY